MLSIISLSDRVQSAFLCFAGLVKFALYPLSRMYRKMVLSGIPQVISSCAQP